MQKAGEAMDSFIQDVHKLADDCDYGALKGELICDQIVAGVTDEDLSDDLQTRANLTLADAVQLARQAEARKEGQQLLCGRVDFLVKQNRPPYSKHGYQQLRPRKHQLQSNQQLPRQHRTNSDSAFHHCGHEPHKRDTCPARQATCANSSNKGHYKAVCRSWL
jgi:hypothetical protein